MHWERIIEILLINRHYEPIKQFIQRILEAIAVITMDEDEPQTQNVRLSLYLELHSALCRVFSLAYGEKPELIIKYIYTKDGLNLLSLINVFQKVTVRNIDDIYNVRIAYNKTRMSDKSVLPVPPAFLSIKDNDSIQLTDFLDAYAHLDPSKMTLNNSDSQYLYYPYLITKHEIALTYCLYEMTKTSSFNDYYKLHQEQTDLYIKLNYINPDYGCNNQSKNATSVYELFKKKDDNPKVYKVSVEGKYQKKLRIAIANAKLSEDDFKSMIKGKPNRSYQRYCAVSQMFNQALKGKADMLVMPESFLPFEWLSVLARLCAANQIAVITGVDHFITGVNVYNLTAVILPYIEQERKCASISFHLKRHYAPNEISLIHGYNYKEVEGSCYELYEWKGCCFPVYCCFELASISERALFQSYADFIVAVEWNHDTKYYGNIMESLCRDIHCYCIQVNTSDYGDSRIIKPAKSEAMNEVQTKGGKNSTILIGEIDIESLRNFQIKEYELQKEDGSFKPTPPDFDKKEVMKRIKNS